MRVLSRLILVLVLFLASVVVPRAAVPEAGAVPDASLAGQLLVASSDIGDPRFSHAVILIVRHNRAGALGIMINRPMGEQPLADLLAAVGQDRTDISGTVQIFAGGPVQPWLGFVVHSAEYRRAGTIDIDGHVAMTTTPEVLRDIGHKTGPRKALVAFGYTGWGPGQLEGELARHSWFTIPEDPALIFDTDRGKIWDEAKARQTLRL